MARNSPDKTYNLKTLYPDLAEEWHKEKNGDLKPEQVTPGSKRSVWWICEKGHEYQTRIQKRTSGTQCPYCKFRKVADDNSIAALKPELAAEWHPTKNGDLTPNDVTPGSVQKVWWRCERGHVWKAMIRERSRGTGCPSCPREIKPERTLAYLYPDLAEELHPTKNKGVTAEEITMSFPLVLWWKCKNGHEYQKSINSRRKGSGCPECAPRKVRKESTLAFRFPEIAEEWNFLRNKDLKPDEISASSWKRVHWKCKKGHEYVMTVYTRVRKKQCPMCKKQKL